MSDAQYTCKRLNCNANATQYVNVRVYACTGRDERQLWRRARMSTRDETSANCGAVLACQQSLLVKRLEDSKFSRGARDIVSAQLASKRERRDKNRSMKPRRGETLRKAARKPGHWGQGRGGVRVATHPGSVHGYPNRAGMIPKLSGARFAAGRPLPSQKGIATRP